MEVVLQGKMSSSVWDMVSQRGQWWECEETWNRKRSMAMSCCSVRLFPAPAWGAYVLSLLTLYVFSAATPWKAHEAIQVASTQRICPIPGGQGKREHQALGQVTPPWFRGSNCLDGLWEGSRL